MQVLPLVLSEKTIHRFQRPVLNNGHLDLASIINSAHNNNKIELNDEKIEALKRSLFQVSGGNDLDTKSIPSLYGLDSLVAAVVI